MFNTASYLFQNTTQRSNRAGEEYRVSASARRLYQRVHQAALVSRLAARLTGRSGSHLASLSAASAGRAIRGRRCAGLQTVPLSRLTGSVSRADDFDADLRPLGDQTQQRWLRVATARQEGLSLPPVQLIRLGNAYFIQDGHHRASVARARGERDIEAEVTDWQLA